MYGIDGGISNLSKSTNKFCLHKVSTVSIKTSHALLNYHEPKMGEQNITDSVSMVINGT